ncbi:hypothetical protein SDC9_146204 [bioreactor metagenome]|uniref:Uncharacterized protein n=1 Tax=bioreactor metagenome TaxID=1076179 RepID=A0A645EAF2_9ZZZZ
MPSLAFSMHVSTGGSSFSKSWILRSAVAVQTPFGPVTVSFTTTISSLVPGNALYVWVVLSSADVVSSPKSHRKEAPPVSPDGLNTTSCPISTLTGTSKAACGALCTVNCASVTCWFTVRRMTWPNLPAGNVAGSIVIFPSPIVIPSVAGTASMTPSAGETS